MSGPWNENLPGFAAWLLTYLLHSTVLIGGIWALCKCLPIRSNVIREGLWTLALFGGLLTASVQTVLDVEPVAGTLRLPELLDARGSEPDPIAAPGDIEPSAPPPRPIEAARAGGTAGPLRDLAPATRAGEPHPVTPRAASRTLSAALFLLAAGLLFAGFALIAMIFRAPKRRPLREGLLPDMLQRLCARARLKHAVALSVSEQIASPVALGILRPEICVPKRSLTDLNAFQLEAMLAHELAHLIRRDPLRLLLARAVERLFFLQPLNRLARRRLFETVESRCDAFAIRQLGTGLPLAECLAEVAGWMTDHRQPVPALAMAQPGSHLTHRVSQLLKQEDALARDRGRPALLPCLSLALPVLVFLSPVVVIRAADRPAARSPAKAAPVLHALDAPDAPDTLAPSARDQQQPLPLLIAEAVGLLERELDALAKELTTLHGALDGQRVSDELRLRLIRLQSRMAELNQRRRVLAVFKTRMLRESGLVSPRPTKSSPGPWSNTR